ncbi:hypothetical protein QFC22_006629 [Naganishia vaughanmartiniae]|uniref:Uncharacterized protein n=1 Tax=Naganishia vaughanmartiniae TaxID=1424756 RepID=A0ACC2WI11_9TREE|nr:hypothetical protein QFC22_006629 [Naganishia vaughanmartiniae]
MDTSRHIDNDIKGDEKGQHLEHVEDVSALDTHYDAKDTIKGTVALTGEGGAVVLIPAPSADPSDYIKANKGYQDITNLITVPTLSMGIGNLIFMPIALAVGRRPVFLFSCALLFVGCIVASQVTNYKYHLGIRIVIGFAAGQSEALVPLMLKEAFFLHERANVLAFQAAFQTIVGCILTIFASNIAASVGWKNWYSVYAGLAGFLLIAAYFFVPETSYERPLSAYTGATEAMPGITTTLATLESQMPGGTTQSNRPALDEVKFGPRTLRKDLLNIGMGTTYATLLEAAPYNWAPKWVGVAQAGQIVVAFVALPTLGIFSDKLITYMAKRNNGVHEPETRLIPLAFPVALGVLSTVLFGAGYAHPEKFHWFVIIFSYCGSYFAFSKQWRESKKVMSANNGHQPSSAVAASVAGQTYLLDCYPTRSGAVLTLICAARGIISFGLTYS